MNQELRILGLIIAALFIGMLVLLFNPDYRIEENLESNLSYYPDIAAGEPIEYVEPHMIDLSNDEVVNDPVEPVQDFEF